MLEALRISGEVVTNLPMRQTPWPTRPCALREGAPIGALAGVRAGCSRR